MQQEINAQSKANMKRSSFWARPKTSRNVQPKQYPLRDRCLEMLHKPPIHMSTKQYSSNGLVGPFVNNFLHPIELYSNGQGPQDATNSQQSHDMMSKKKSMINGTPKRTFFCGTLSKKKVSPIDGDRDKDAAKMYSTDGQSSGDQCGILVPPMNNCGLFKNYDLETGNHIMMPTKSLTKLSADEIDSNPVGSALERETRDILLGYGITEEMLEDARANAPRSDIIGVYRIVINRLQKQSWLTRKHVQLALQEMPKVEKRIERSCCIL